MRLRVECIEVPPWNSTHVHPVDSKVVKRSLAFVSALDKCNNNPAMKKNVDALLLKAANMPNAKGDDIWRLYRQRDMPAMFL